MSDPANPAPTARPAPLVVQRHSGVTRVTHWVNAFCILVLLMSGLQILNAHPALYWGQFGSDFDTPWLAFRDGVPGWMTLPSYQDLATGRRWHFFFAWLFVINGAIYLAAGAVSGHLKRDLAPTREELSPRHIGEEIANHLRLTFAKGEAAKRYNILQKLAYMSVIAGLLPLILLTGLTMSPGFNAFAPWLLDLFGGRQSARSLHFIFANLLVLFVVVHVAMVILAGFWNALRSMITGRYVVKPEDGQ
jgi:thiosulfate reductase cytochrome b subunit